MFFLELPCFLHDPTNVNLISVSSASLKPSLYIWKFLVHILLKPSLKNFEHNLTSQENTPARANILFQQHKRRLYTLHNQMVNTKIRLIIFFAAEDAEALYSQQKQDWEVTMAQIMNSILPNSDLN